jgi:EAL domain-containing protein (putative c-di-GMP-specific phosphodiesterase class I)
MSTTLEYVIERESVTIVFQPILFVKKQCVLGYEALARATGPGGTPVPPADLFVMAIAEQKTVTLDRLCRAKAMESFAAHREVLGRESILFVNFESSILDKGVLGSGAVVSAARKSGLLPGNIVIEINESKVHDVSCLEAFVENHRKRGFLVALDDLGTGDSNLVRVPRLRPNIIKLDRELIRDLDRDFFKQQTVKSLAHLSRQIGAILLAEGVETQGEADAALDLGAELAQGFYFAKPMPPEVLAPGASAGLMRETCSRLKRRAVERLAQRKNDARTHQDILDWAIGLLGSSSQAEFEAFLRRMVDKNDFLECAYIVDEAGIQCTSTVFSGKKRVVDGRLFIPAAQGADHSAKEYFYSLVEAGLDRYTTDPYVSLASGSLCTTLSGPFCIGSGRRFVLCLDINAVRPSVGERVG